MRLKSFIPLGLALALTGATQAEPPLIEAAKGRDWDAVRVLLDQGADAAVTALHVLTGLGQVGSSLILGFFRGLGFWWGAPLVIGAALVLMIGYTMFGLWLLSTPIAA